MTPKIEQWMRDAAKEIVKFVREYQEDYDGRGIGHPTNNGVAVIANILAAHAPSPSPDICEKCGQEVIDGHWSLVCHKPACIKALQEQDADYLGEAAAQPTRSTNHQPTPDASPRRRF